jgi:hypothetical protein
VSKYNVAKTEQGVYEKTLVANIVDTVEFAANLGAVEIVKEDEGPAIYFTVDSGDPTVKGQACYQVPGGILSVRTVESKANPKTTVKLISSGTPKYSVCRVSDR